MLLVIQYFLTTFFDDDIQLTNQFRVYFFLFQKKIYHQKVTFHMQVNIIPRNKEHILCHRNYVRLHMNFDASISISFEFLIFFRRKKRRKFVELFRLFILFYLKCLQELNSKKSHGTLNIFGCSLFTLLSIYREKQSGPHLINSFSQRLREYKQNIFLK